MGQETEAPSSRGKGPGARLWLKTLPAVFVFLWSTGFVAGKYGMPHTGPFTFLSIRYLVVIFLLTGVALLTSAPWPKRNEVMPIAISGLFVHAGYLGGVFAALSVGVEAGVIALVVGLSPC